MRLSCFRPFSHCICDDCVNRNEATRKRLPQTLRMALHVQPPVWASFHSSRPCRILFVAIEIKAQLTLQSFVSLRTFEVPCLVCWPFRRDARGNAQGPKANLQTSLGRRTATWITKVRKMIEPWGAVSSHTEP